MTVKILRYNNMAYIIARQQVILIDSSGSVKKIVNTNDTLMDALIKDGKLYTLGIIQLPGVEPNLTAYKSYITIYGPSLSQLSKVEFDQHRFDGFAILNNDSFVSSLLDSKIYKISANKIINFIQLPEQSYPLQVLNFNDEIIAIGKNEIFTLPLDLSKYNILINESICSYYSRAIVYDNKLYANCFRGNKTIVYDLLQNKLIKQINTTLPFYVWNFSNKIYVTSGFAKKLYVIDPSTNEIISTISFEKAPTVIG
jgi:YVTN family beta-propeller protein